MGLTHRVAELRGQMWAWPDRARFRSVLTSPSGIGAVLAFEAVVICDIAHVEFAVRRATIGELFEYLGYVLLALALATEAGASRLGLAVLSIGGVGLVANRLFATEAYSGELAVYTLVFHLIRANAQGLSKEEFDRRYYSPPGPLSFSALKSRPPSIRPQGQSAPEPDV